MTRVEIYRRNRVGVCKLVETYLFVNDVDAEAGIRWLQEEYTDAGSWVIHIERLSK
jgi:hypothetical protein